MSKMFFESYGLETQQEKYHGKPLIRQRGFLQPRVIFIIKFLLSILFIALINVIALGLMALLHTPIREFILGC